MNTRTKQLLITAILTAGLALTGQVPAALSTIISAFPDSSELARTISPSMKTEELKSSAKWAGCPLSPSLRGEQRSGGIGLQVPSQLFSDSCRAVNGSNWTDGISSVASTSEADTLHQGVL